MSKSDIIHYKTQFWTEESKLKQTSADLLAVPRYVGNTEVQRSLMGTEHLLMSMAEGRLRASV